MTKSHLLAVSLMLAVLAGGTAQAAPMPAEPQPTNGVLKDGLAVRYYYAKFNHVRELKTWMKYKDGKPGAPLARLDYNVGKGDVLTSGADELVGAHITGYLRFDVPGTYRFQVTSNDGVRIDLGGERLYEDPDVHPDRTSEELPVRIAAAGWYPLEILYFEKKNTSTLELRWAPPGVSDFKLVPASAFKHD